MRANWSFPDEVKASRGRGVSIEHMLWGEGYPTLKRGACCACVKMGFYGKRGVFGCFFEKSQHIFRARLCEVPKTGMRNLHDLRKVFRVCTSIKF